MRAHHRSPFALALALTLPLACTPNAPPTDAGTDVAALADAPIGDTAPTDTPRDTGPTACATATAPSIRTAAMLTNGAYAPVATLLADGRALIAGGYDFAFGVQDTALAFDPATDALGDLGTLQTPGNFRALTTLANGTVLIVGGFDQTAGSLRNAEIFDPSATTFTSTTGMLATPREAHTATRLPDGTVLVAGGLQAMHFVFHQTAEIFDPTAGTFRAVRNRMTVQRAFHAAELLPTLGAVLLVGGDSGHGELASAERYDIASGAFVATAGSRTHAGKAVAAVTLLDGRVLVAGGANATDGTLADSDLYDPSTDRFVPTAPMHTRRMAHTLTRLSDGRVLAVGGWSDSTMPSASSAPLEVFDPATGTWDLLPIQLAQPRHDHRAVLLPDCRVLIVGGQTVVGAGAPSGPRAIEVVTVPSRR